MAEPFGNRPTGQELRKFRRGMYLLPSIFTVGNMFCGYACMVYVVQGDLSTAAPFIGIAIVLDTIDGSIARLTGTSSAFGLQLDSLADVVSFGLAPALLAWAWGLSDFKSVGWGAGFIFVSAAAMRLARFNIQATSQLDKRYFVGMPAPAAAGVIAATVFARPEALSGYPQALGLAVVLVPAALMVSTIRFRSFKTINFGWAPSYMPPLLFALLLAFIFAWTRVTLLVLAYGYLSSAFIGLAINRWRARRMVPPAAR